MTIRTILENQVNQKNNMEITTHLGKTAEAIKNYAFDFILGIFEDLGVADSVITKFQPYQNVYLVTIPKEFHGAEDLQIQNGKICGIETLCFMDKLIIQYTINCNNNFVTKEESEVFATEEEAQENKNEQIEVCAKRNMKKDDSNV